MHKYIFLDIDGVLNQNVPYSATTENLDLACVKVLQNIVKATNAYVVLHSGWKRYLSEDLTSTYEPMNKILQTLKHYNILLHDKVINLSTPEIIATRKFSKVKPLEIEAYVQEHDIQYYVVLDDLYLSGSIAKHAYRVNKEKGLTTHDIQPIIRILESVI